MTDQKNRHWLLRFLTLGLLFVLVLGLVAAASFSGGRYKDRFRRWLLYGSSLTENRYIYSADSGYLFGQVGPYLAVLSQNSLQLLRDDGTAQFDETVSLAVPALITGGGLLAAWDVGGTRLVVADTNGILFERDEGARLLSVRLSDSGHLAVTEEKSGYKGAVTVYDQKQEKIFTFNSSTNFLLDAAVSRDGRRLLAVTMGQEAGGYVTRFVLYDLGREDPLGTTVFQEGLVLDLVSVSTGYAAAADEMALFLSSAGEITGRYSYAGAYLRDYTLTGDGFCALLLGRYRAGVVGRLVTVDSAGQELGSLEVSKEVLDISAAGDRVAVLYSDELVIYEKDLTRYASTVETGLAGRVLLAEDGSALAASADSAWRFLP